MASHRHRKAAHRRRWDRWPVLAVAASAAAGFASRVVDLTSNPRGFFADEASYGLNAHLVLTTGRDEHGALLPLLFRAFGEHKLPVFAYAEMPFLAVLGRTELAVRLTAAVLGTLTVVTTYLLGKEIFRRELPAVAAAACLAILPWHIHHSRIGFEGVSLPLVLTTGLWLFLRAVRRSSSLLPAAAVLGLAFWTYRAAWVALPPVLLFLVLSHRREVRARGRAAAVAGAVFIALLLPLAWHVLVGEGDRSSQAWIFNVDHDGSRWALAWDQYRSYFSFDYLFRVGDDSPILRHHLPGFGVLYWFLLPLVLAAVVHVLATHRRPEVLLVVLLAAYPLSGALSDASPISSRAILGSTTFALLSGLGLAVLVDAAVRVKVAGRVAVAATLSVAAAVCAVDGFTAYADRYFGHYPALADGYWGWQDGPEEILARFDELQEDYDDLYLDGAFNGPEVFIPFYLGDRCPACKVGGLDRAVHGRRQLFAIRAENPDLQRIPVVVVDVIRGANGEPSFYFVEVVRSLGTGRAV